MYERDLESYRSGQESAASYDKALAAVCKSGGEWLGSGVKSTYFDSTPVIGGSGVATSLSFQGDRDEAKGALFTSSGSSTKVYELSDPQELRGDRTSAKALDRSVDTGRLGSAVRSAASVLRVIERHGNNPRTGRYIEKKPSNEGH
ncbi:hypothetical protein V6N11_029071 [Hibiscus sabdariffa]|uniref:Uncharacterized protein n=1 Tax=Hibiscus sabdariffa TaxID=183260 RepID=A0ABR1ZZ50_9ROSI